MNHILGASAPHSSGKKTDSLSFSEVLKSFQNSWNAGFLLFFYREDDTQECLYSSIGEQGVDLLVKGLFQQMGLDDWPTSPVSITTAGQTYIVQPVQDSFYVAWSHTGIWAEGELEKAQQALQNKLADALKHGPQGDYSKWIPALAVPYKLFHEINDGAVNAFTISDVEGRLVYANAKAMAWLGLSDSDINKTFVYEFEKAFKSDREAWQRHVGELKKKRAIGVNGVWWNHQNNSWMDVAVKVTYLQHGNKDFVSAEAMDISEHSRVQIQLQEELELQQLMLSLSSGFINSDLNQLSDLIQLSLKQIGEFFGTDRTYIFDYDYVTQTTSNSYEWCADGIRPEIGNLQQVPMEMVPQWLEKHAKGEIMLIKDVLALGDEDRQLREILASQEIKSLIALPMMREGVPIGFVGLDSVKTKRSYSDREVRILELFAQMLVNAAIRMEYNEEMETQDIRYRTLIENINLGLMEIDEDYTVNYVNNTLLKNFGYRKEEVLGKSVIDFVDNKENILESAEEKIRLLASGEQLSLEFPSFTKSGERRYLLVSVARQDDMHGFLKGYILAFVDLTTQKQLEFDLKQAIIEIEKASESKERFFANISHEMRTPLNVITGVMAELNKDESDQNFLLLENARRASNHLLNLVNNVLDMAMINAGKITLSYVEFDIHKVVNDMVAIVQGSMDPGKPVEIHKNIDTSVAQFIAGDKYKVEQVLMNLIGNAAKFTKEGWVKVNVSAIHEHGNQLALRFSISDTGVGMRKVFMERMFKEFERDFKTNDLTQGTGLGLAISNELVKIMGGDLHVNSAYGKGTHIYFELTFDKVEKDIEEEEFSYNHTLLEGKKILLAEDNPMNQVLMRRQLSYYGAELRMAGNGKEALEIMKTYSPDLILMDIQMPKMDGVECTKRIRKHFDGNELPILAITANAFKNELDEYLSQGMDDYIIKPYTEMVLIDKIANLLGLSQRLRREDSAGNPRQSECLAQKVVSNLKTISGSDHEFFQQLMDTFMEMSSTTLRQMRKAMEAGDVEKVSRLAHRIKPSLKQLELFDIQGKMFQLEQIELPLEKAKALFESVEKELGGLVTKLENIPI
ncbi:response regulator [Flagellimonas marinaquae]